MAFDPMRSAITTKKVAGFHSFDFCVFAAFALFCSAIETGSVGCRKAFGMIEFQIEFEATRGTVEVDELASL